MYKITEEDKEVARLIKTKLNDFEKDFEKNFATQEATLELLARGVSFSDSLEFRSSRLVWNIACFINIASYDLKIIVKALIFAKQEWEKRLFARQASLLIYETINDLYDLFGKDFRNVIAELEENETFELDLRAIISQLNSYKSMHFDRLKQIRNVSIAHRDNDSIQQLQVIQSISWMESINMATEFDKILNMAGGLLQRLTGVTPGLDNKQNIG